jgi:hypothetical protein
MLSLIVPLAFAGLAAAGLLLAVVGAIAFERATCVDHPRNEPKGEPC